MYAHCGLLYFGLFNPFNYFPLPLYHLHPIFQQFSIHTLISSTFYTLWYAVLLMLYHSLFLSLFPQGIVPLLQTCSTFEFVYDRSCLCIYVYLWIFHVWEKTCGLSLSEPGLVHLTWCFHPVTFKRHIIITYGWVKLHCVYIAHFLDPFISCRAPGLFSKLGYCE
jgi:hypothetical protein